MMKNIDKTKMHKAKAFVVVCMDFRFWEDTLENLKQRGYELSRDMFVLAGVSLGMNQKVNPHWSKSLFDHIDISIKLHHIKELILMDHMDCGAYATFCPNIKNKEDERKEHLKNLKEAKQTLVDKYPELKVSTWICGLDGKVEEIEGIGEGCECNEAEKKGKKTAKERKTKDIKKCKKETKSKKKAKKKPENKEKRVRGRKKKEIQEKKIAKKEKLKEKAKKK